MTVSLAKLPKMVPMLVSGLSSVVQGPSSMVELRAETGLVIVAQDQKIMGSTRPLSRGRGLG
jgi:hypothetical protein